MNTLSIQLSVTSIILEIEKITLYGHMTLT